MSAIPFRTRVAARSPRAVPVRVLLYSKVRVSAGSPKETAIVSAEGARGSAAGWSAKSGDMAATGEGKGVGKPRRLAVLA